MAEKSHTPSRQAMLAGLAAAPVARLPTIAGIVAEHDPIFAAFAEFERAEAAKEVISKAAEDLQGETWEAIRAAGLDPRGIFTRRQLEDWHKAEIYSEEDNLSGLAKLEGPPNKYQ